MVYLHGIYMVVAMLKVVRSRQRDNRPLCCPMCCNRRTTAAQARRTSVSVHFQIHLSAQKAYYLRGAAIALVASDACLPVGRKVTSREEPPKSRVPTVSTPRSAAFPAAATDSEEAASSLNAPSRPCTTCKGRIPDQIFTSSFYYALCSP